MLAETDTEETPWLTLLARTMYELRHAATRYAATPENIADRISESTADVLQALRQLQSLGMVKRDGQFGDWSVAPAKEEV